MSKLTIVLIVILVVLAAALVVLYFVGRKAQRRQAVQKEQMDAVAQTVSMLIIDKKKMKLSESGLPVQVIEQTPKLLRRNKLPIVKAKVGPRIMTLACDAQVFELLPVKKEVKVVVSGIYITEIKSARGGLEVPGGRSRASSSVISASKGRFSELLEHEFKGQVSKPEHLSFSLPVFLIPA